MATRTAMTSRERWLAAVRMESVDRLPFWPKLNASYPIAQEAPFRDMEIAAIHDWIGSDPHVGIGGCVREARGNCSQETVIEGGIQRIIRRTPHGEMQTVKLWDHASQSWHPVEFPVKDVEDIRRMTAFFEDTTPELDDDALEKARARKEEIGESAVSTCTIGESPLMHWVEWLAGVENAHLLLADHTDEVEALFDAIHRVLLRKTEIVAEHSPADLIYSMENTSTSLISPAQYRRYCFGHISDYGRVLQAHGRLFVLHMCGLLKDILPDLAKVPADAFEAFTAPTLGDTTFLDGRSACPDKCLIGGTQATLWTKPAEPIIAQIRHALDELPHHRGIVVTSAGVMPPLCRPETIRAVCEWVKRYPANM